MKQLVAALLIASLLFSCKKNESDNPVYELLGRYRGTFNRTGVDTSQVSIYFKDNHTFEGTGGPVNYPAVCSGSFLQNGNSLAVNDTCAWTANFDWSLIFDGNYNLSFTSENAVRIWRSNGTLTDEYILNRITR
jgi:hypothetical protein